MADAGRLQNLLQQAQGLIADLTSLPPDADSTMSAYPRIFGLARQVVLFCVLLLRNPRQLLSERRVSRAPELTSFKPQARASMSSALSLWVGRNSYRCAYFCCL